MGGGFLKKKKEARALQQQLQQMQSQMSHQEYVGSTSSDLVKITLTGQFEMKKIEIKRDCVDPEDVEGLETLIKSAYNQAVKKVQDSMGALNPTSLFG